MEYYLPLLNTLVFLSLAAIHIYWLFGGQWALNATVPTDSNGRKLFRPGKLATLAVALGLTFFAMLNMAFAGWIDTGFEPRRIRYGLLAIAMIFLLRAIGDFRYIGFAKRFRRSPFARWDTKLYSPLCLALAITHWLLCPVVP